VLRRDVNEFKMAEALQDISKLKVCIYIVFCSRILSERE
jgi:hypothetical protein